MVRITAVSVVELVRRAREGDREAFGLLVDRHAPMVRRICRAVLRHPEDADDAAQDAFLSAWNGLPRFDPREAFLPWLARIAMNAARDVRRRRRVRDAEEIPTDLASRAPGPDTAAHAALLRERMDGAMQGLTERQRVALVLYEVEGYSHAEVAEVLGVPEGTARSDVFHAKRRLRPLLGRE
ncbi:MAG: sigma-70 family RNA polymerase sigma factor [Gemmatimonadota bacterium]|nr:sigma-70 family RNA polymerase sigma factor [Gemmatimonadota bacterium]MDH4347854.1 sigma-70 family RNA polymerase sigma factor [Gemmatimonadota bacterium]MDH5284097.1 sigma-70 family RNA polymerase sigma factor [Gemmatimonadota bacterium]